MDDIRPRLKIQKVSLIQTSVSRSRDILDKGLQCEMNSYLVLILL
jgi:hypothetical protein